MRRRFILLFVMMLMATFAFAQDAGLQVSRIMDGKIIPVSRMVVTKVRGRALSRYKLSYYRSARFEATATEEKLCANAIEEDCKSKAQSSVVSKSSRKSSTVFMLLPEHGINRFISYVKQKSGKGKYKITVIYMEGSVASLKELETLINK